MTMDGLITALFCLGMLFPAISLVTLLISLLRWLAYRQNETAILIPFIGPVLLSVAVLLSHRPLWYIPLAWVCDLGTVAFLTVSPRLIWDWWTTSSYTRVLELHGNRDAQACTLSFHRTGHYLLKKTWQRQPGEYGILGLGELGTYIEQEGTFHLTSDFGASRTLTRQPDGAMTVIEGNGWAEEEGRRADHSIGGWILREQSC